MYKLVPSTALFTLSCVCVCVSVDCAMNVHHKCQDKVANLCGINQKLLAEALTQVSQVSSRRCGNERISGASEMQHQLKLHYHSNPHVWMHRSYERKQCRQCVSEIWSCSSIEILHPALRPKPAQPPRHWNLR